MIKNPAKLRQFEDDFNRSDPPNYRRNLRLYEAMYKEAVLLGVLPAKDPLENIEWKIEFARKLNVRTAPQEDRSHI